MKKTMTIPTADTIKAADLGRKAFHAGKMRVPAWDAELGSMYAGRTVKQVIDMLDAWLKAWDTANLAAPVPGFKRSKTMEEIKAQIAANRADPMAGTYDGLTSSEIGQHSSLLMFGENGEGYPGDEAWSRIAD